MSDHEVEKVFEIEAIGTLRRPKKYPYDVINFRRENVIALTVTEESIIAHLFIANKEGELLQFMGDKPVKITVLHKDHTYDIKDFLDDLEIGGRYRVKLRAWKSLIFDYFMRLHDKDTITASGPLGNLSAVNLTFIEEGTYEWIVEAHPYLVKRLTTALWELVSMNYTQIPHLRTDTWNTLTSTPYIEDPDNANETWTPTSSYSLTSNKKSTAWSLITEYDLSVT